MLLGAEDNLVGHSRALLWDVAYTHILAYQHDDIDLLMSTVSPRGGIWAGILPSQGPVILRTADEVREAYSKALSEVRIAPARGYVAVASDWYIFGEFVTTITHKASGESIEMLGIGFYGVDDLGVAIDTDVGSLLNGAGIAETPQAKLAMYDAHQARLDALARGDVDGSVVGLGQRMDLFVPCFDLDDERLQQHVGGRDAYRAWVETLLKRYRVESMERETMLTMASYVFSEMSLSLVDLETGDASRARYALCEVTGPDRLVRGGVGIATKA